jgi:pSer/pThr/pTyr-binding forkhead associated (FHA) protein
MFGTGAELTATGGSDIEVPAGEHEALAGAEELRAARAGLSGPGEYLVFQEGGRLQTMGLTRELTRIGRSLVADLRFDDPTVSRRHALIVRELAGMRVLDDRSMYGVFVNGERVDSRRLSDGDVIWLGRHRLLYQRLAAPPRRPRRRPQSALPPAPRPSRA